MSGHRSHDRGPDAPGYTPPGWNRFLRDTNGARTGSQVRLLTSVAPQEPLLDDLCPFLDELHIVPGAATSTFENLYDEAGKRTQILHEIAARLGPADVPCAWRDTPLVHLAPLTGEVDPALAACFPNATVLLTPQGWLRERDDACLVRFQHWFDTEVLRHVDIVVFSEEDFAEAPGLEADFAASVPWLFVTRAERGGTCYHHGVPFDYATPQLPVVNTTGAGDVFAAVVLACAHHLERDMPRVCQVAAQLGATTITRPWLEGAPTLQEARQALKLLE